MLDVLQFVFSSFWIWLGTVILLGAAFGGVARTVAIVAAVARRGDRGRVRLWPLAILAIAILFVLAVLPGCALFGAPQAYDEHTVRNVEQSILWAEEDGAMTRAVLVARGADERELTSFDVRRTSHVSRLKSWYAAELAKRANGGNTAPVERPAPQERRAGEVHAAAAITCATCDGDGQEPCDCIIAFFAPHDDDSCRACDGRGWRRAP